VDASVEDASDVVAIVPRLSAGGAVNVTVSLQLQTSIDVEGSLSTDLSV